MKQIAWVKVIQNKYIKRCMSIVGIVIVLLGAMLLYHITGLRKNEYTKKEPLLLNWTVVSENQTDTDVDLNTFRFDNILTDKGVFGFLPLFSLYTGIHPKENGSAFGE